jgi:hypothetical protein
MSETSADEAVEWAVVEIFGHRSHAGQVREEERFGAKMLRIDVPTPVDGGEPSWKTHWYGGASVFSLTPTDETTVMRMNTPYRRPGLYLPSSEEDMRSDQSIGADPDQVLPF